MSAFLYIFIGLNRDNHISVGACLNVISLLNDSL